ncbi:mRNA triphosphatase CET1 [Gloeophyllum trabeum ATCC 11539]|uniref:mRNA-capping enzyme subunit beta n=1 Tax=Gloeophyllum trabeum (strain ATCC 11539 / FP-39264 / Madison 617) TaxID=670483 RepID=S7PUT0_GLOTA|nr:mRNA triphosphatase CET1 [Gloeophyllum trabeum ATCC 11539]EPQ51042.1 mRNA triphosphatase CET1 [Gloeophyllum trabeum ATCC 11539]
MSAPATNLPPLSLSILGVEPLDEFIREVADFVHHMISTRPDVGGQVELEAKIGILRNKHSGQRAQLPVLVETILDPNFPDVRFESNMSIAKHRHYNELLNNLMTSSLQPGHPTTPLQYAHRYLIDSFYPADNPRDREKIRVTRDEKSGAVLECMKKMRLGDLNVYSPKRGADWRISVSLEIPVPPPSGNPTHTRRKDRLSYTHEEFVIDLTQVTSTTSPNAPPEVLHELELEVARPELLLATASKRNDLNVPEQERYAFDELIRAFVNDARILVRNSGEGWH